MLLFYFTCLFVLLQDAILLYANWQLSRRHGITPSLFITGIAVLITFLAIGNYSWEILLWGFGLHRATILLELWGRIRIQQTGAMSLFITNLLSIIGAFSVWFFQRPELFALIYSLFWGLTLMIARRMQKYRTSASRI